MQTFSIDSTSSRVSAVRYERAEGVWGRDIGVNATGDAGDASPAIFCNRGRSIIMPHKQNKLSKLLQKSKSKLPICQVPIIVFALYFYSLKKFDIRCHYNFSYHAF